MRKPGKGLPAPAGPSVRAALALWSTPPMDVCGKANATGGLEKMAGGRAAAPSWSVAVGASSLCPSRSFAVPDVPYGAALP